MMYFKFEFFFLLEGPRLNFPKIYPNFFSVHFDNIMEYTSFSCHANKILCKMDLLLLLPTHIYRTK